METLGTEALKKNLLFQDLGPEQLKKIIGFSKRQTFEAGSLVFSPDEEAKQLFILEKGLVGIIIQIRPGTQLTISTESKGGLFGWSALVPPHRYTASAKCLEQSQLLALEGAKLRELCYLKPDIGVRIMEDLPALLLCGFRAPIFKCWTPCGNSGSSLYFPLRRGKLVPVVMPE